MVLLLVTLEPLTLRQLMLVALLKGDPDTITDDFKATYHKIRKILYTEFVY